MSGGSGREVESARRKLQAGGGAGPPGTPGGGRGRHARCSGRGAGVRTPGSRLRYSPRVPDATPPAPRPIPDSHCSACGSAYPAGGPWPRQCAACGSWAYRNPLPVAVALVPVRDEHGLALVVIRRTIEPSRGTLALPGGFIDHGESWEQAVARELGEETGIAAASADVVLADALTDAEGTRLLLFGLLPERPAAQLPPSTPTNETAGYQLLHEPAELGFPLHTLAVRRWFAGDYRTAARRTDPAR